MIASKSRDFYDLIPKPDYVEDIHHKKGNTQDIINVILDAYKFQNFRPSKSMRPLASALKTDDIYNTLYNVWYFVRNNITYKADDPGKEKIKDPAYLYHHGVGDCKSFSLMVGSIISNYKDVSFSFRFTSYNPGDNFSHVYVVAKIPGKSRMIILDATHSAFDEEAEYVRKKDFKMTEISHIHGGPALIGRARPKIAEAFADGPRRAFSPAIVGVEKLTQGELKLHLMDQQIQTMEAYYGDNNQVFSQARQFISQALSNLPNFNVSGYVRPEHERLISLIMNAKKRHIDQVIKVDHILNQTGISGKEIKWTGIISPADMEKCVKAAGVETADGTWRFFHRYLHYSGVSYKFRGVLEECFNQAAQREWSKNNFFDKEDFKKGAPSLLYEFIENTVFYKLLNAEGSAKKVIQQSYIDAFATVSGFDRDNVNLYTRNGITYAGAAAKIKDITPEGFLSGLSDGIKYKGQPGINEPATTVLIITTIASAIIAILKAMKTNPTLEQNLQSLTKASLSESTGPNYKDFDKEVKNLELMNWLVPGAIVLLGGAIIFSPNKKKAS